MIWSNNKGKWWHLPGGLAPGQGPSGLCILRELWLSHPSSHCEVALLGSPKPRESAEIGKSRLARGHTAQTQVGFEPRQAVPEAWL